MSARPPDSQAAMAPRQRVDVARAQAAVESATQRGDGAERLLEQAHVAHHEPVPFLVQVEVDPTTRLGAPLAQRQMPPQRDAPALVGALILVRPLAQAGGRDLGAKGQAPLGERLVKPSAELVALPR